MRGTLAMPMLKPWMFGSDVVPLCNEKHRQATRSMAALAAAAAVAASALAAAASALAVAASAFAAAFSVSRRS